MSKLPKHPGVIYCSTLVKIELISKLWGKLFNYIVFFNFMPHFLHKKHANEWWKETYAKGEAKSPWGCHSVLFLCLNSKTPFYQFLMRFSNPRANKASQLQLAAPDRQHAVGIRTGDEVPNSQLKVQIPEELPLMCWALNPSTSTNMTIHKLLMSLNPWQIADDSYIHGSSRICR